MLNFYEKKKRKKWIFIFFLMFLLCNAVFVAIAFLTMDDSVWEWGEQPFQNERSSFQINRPPFETGFNVARFPREYRGTYPTLLSWQFIWYELPRSDDPRFQNGQLEEKWPRIASLLHERHPIMTQSIPENTLAELSELKEVRTVDGALDHSILVGEIVYGELALWQDPSWVEAEEAWETNQIQAMILGTYFYFLDDQSDLDVNLYNEIDDLISSVGMEDWFRRFSEHLGKWWPED